MENKTILETTKHLQQGEITEKKILLQISKTVKDEKNRSTLIKMAEEEQKHYDIWKSFTKVNMKPKMITVFIFALIARILGYTFAIKRMERWQNEYNVDSKTLKMLENENSQLISIFEDEIQHEKELMNMLDEERLKYIGSMILGLNDALVEMAGSLAGYSFALASNKLIALAGLITGISATLSMASSEFLSARSDGEENAFRSASYTGITYLFTVILLILPYLLLPDKMFGTALVIMMITVVVIIAAFNYYISVAKDYSFKKRFFEMAGISISVALLSFLIGLLVKEFLGVDL
ncbi:VIT1/CCC1 transporter family protein [Clostridium oryzae]|uniref:VIT family protein n=1 Tax=Clostridium oryzae TaxID=1450648 RepID=A0A1V4IPE0_9CLOT|nr:VIT1/CCC1 family protein [Clostridium oryzae]OPJ61921.1 VIT family protein [Clostridium oryzae]